MERRGAPGEFLRKHSEKNKSQCVFRAIPDGVLL
jgi:hypothetical protein